MKSTAESSMACQLILWAVCRAVAQELGPSRAVSVVRSAIQWRCGPVGLLSTGRLPGAVRFGRVCRPSRLLVRSRHGRSE
jgi:hypothetical protein